MPTKFSIIIPIYKVEDYLEQCISSVLNQAYENTEIILVDDGSPDRCPMICDEYAKSDVRIKVIHQKNQGQSAARNAGINASTGQYILFLDGDDFLISNIFEVCENIILANNDVDVVLHNYKFYDCNTDFLIETSPIDYSELDKLTLSSTQAMNRILELNSLFEWYPWQLVIKRKVIVENNLYFEEGVLYEDARLTFKFILHSNLVSFNNSTSLIYRINRPGSTTKQKTLKPELDRIRTASRNIEWVNEFVKDGNLRTKLNNNFACMIFPSIINFNYLPKQDREKLISEIKKEYNITKFVKERKQKFSKLLCDILGLDLGGKILYIRSRLKYRGN